MSGMLSATVRHVMMNKTMGMLIAATSVLAYVGCVTDTSEPTGDALQAVHSDQEVAANCSANNPKKQAVCHIPPGNPANAHTICISTSAVDKHIQLHGDYLGACDPGNGDGGDASGQGGGPSGVGGSSAGGAGGGAECSTEYPPCSSNADCDANSYCAAGCCVPYTN